MTVTDATRLTGGNSDAIRLAGDSYRTRLAPSIATDDKTRLVQEGYQSKLASGAAGEQPDTSEFYKVGDKIGDRYEVSAIHHGAMGVVYGCFDHNTKGNGVSSNIPTFCWNVRTDPIIDSSFKRDAKARPLILR